MAKQRGIHQISGKVNNLCYYEQKYIRGGLIRRINEAMSERLKTDPVFENTRHANTIFGACSMFAGAILGLLGRRNAFLFKPYRQALLTRAVKKFMTSTNISERYPSIGDYTRMQNDLPIIIDGIVKNKLSTSFPGLPRRLSHVSVDSTYEFEFPLDDLQRFCSKYNCIGVQITITAPCYIYSQSYSYDLREYEQPVAGGGGRGVFYDWYLQDEDSALVISAATGSTDDATTFWIIYASPILSIYQDRPVVGETGACCGVVTFIAQ